MNKYLLIVMASVAVFSQAADASLIGVDTVDGGNSLYASAWGHPYNTSTSGEYGAVARTGAGSLARAFEVGSVSYGFSSGDQLHITATGCVVDNGSNCTGPDYMGGDYRGLPVYALIGVWSSSEAAISPIDLISFNPAFVIGALLDVVVPDFASPLYLFMATNDGDFSDNSGAYSVRIEKAGHVPAPSVLSLMLFAVFFRKKFFAKTLRNKPC
ncbi:MAG: hypothetical protein KBT88_14360 [Gammaproteobacteria bacterium]|nr:hypothetical protein [Gammaproteobacteria bacterium]